MIMAKDLKNKTRNPRQPHKEESPRYTYVTDTNGDVMRMRI